MASKPVDIGIAADTRSFQKGIKSGVVEPLDDVVESLEDVSKAGDNAGDDLVDAMKDAQRATEKLADEHEQLNDAIAKGSRTAFRKFDDASDDATKHASQDVDEFKKEAVANFSEVSSSFSGDMSSAIDLVQGTLGGLAGSIPGVGIALAGVGAVAGAVYSAWEASTAAAAQRVQDMYDDMLESGQKFLSKDYIQQQISLIVNGTDGAAISMKNLQRLAEDTGIATSDLLLAFSGDLSTRNRVIDEAKASMVDYQGAIERAGEGTATAQDNATIAAGQLIAKLREQNSETAKAAGNVQAADTALSKLNATQGRTYDDMLRNQGEAYDSLARVATGADTVASHIKAIPSANVRVDLTFDKAKWQRDIQRGLDSKQWRVMVNAYTAPNRNGKAAP